jgi:pimeloyl-ACP methyl ester carboxylesterase
MNHTCEQPSGVSVITAATISPREASRRFEREAIRGVCDTGRYRCAYFSWGQGPPLVLIPGLSDNARSLLMLAAQLAEHFRCVGYDLPTGRGDGARLRRYTHAGLVQDFWALLDRLGIGESYVFGSSFGSTIALAALHAQPERLKRGILQGGFAYRPLRRGELFLCRLGRYLPGSLRALPRREAAFRRVHHAAFARRSLEHWRFFLAQTGSPPIRALAYQALLLPRLDLRPLLAGIRQPVLLVCGDSDPLVGKPYEDALLRGLPNVGRVELSQCGHFPYFSHPEVLAEVVRRFLTPPACCV